MENPKGYFYINLGLIEYIQEPKNWTEQTHKFELRCFSVALINILIPVFTNRKNFTE